MHTPPSGTKQSQLHVSTPTPPNSPLHVVSGFASDEDLPSNNGFVPDADTYEAAIKEPNEYSDASFTIDIKGARLDAEAFIELESELYDSLELQDTWLGGDTQDLFIDSSDSEEEDSNGQIRELLRVFMHHVKYIAPVLFADKILSEHNLSVHSIRLIQQVIPVLAKQLAKLFMVDRIISEDDYRRYRAKIQGLIRSQVVDADEVLLDTANMMCELYGSSKALRTENPSIYINLHEFFTSFIDKEILAVLHKSPSKGTPKAVKKINAILMRYNFKDIATPIRGKYKMLLLLEGVDTYIPAMQANGFQVNMVGKLSSSYVKQARDILTVMKQSIENYQPIQTQDTNAYMQRICQLLDYCKLLAKYVKKFHGMFNQGGYLFIYYYLKYDVIRFMDRANFAHHFNVLGHLRQALAQDIANGHIDYDNTYFHLSFRLEALQARLPFALLRRSAFNGNNALVKALKYMNRIIAIWHNLFQCISRFKVNLKRFGFIGVYVKGADYEQDIWVQPLLHLMVRVKRKAIRTVTFGIVQKSPISLTTRAGKMECQPKKCEKDKSKYMVQDKCNEILKMHRFSLFPSRHQSERSYDPALFLNSGCITPVSSCTVPDKAHTLLDDAHYEYIPLQFGSNLLGYKDTYFRIYFENSRHQHFVHEKTPPKTKTPQKKPLTIPYDQKKVLATLEQLERSFFQI